MMVLGHVFVELGLVVETDLTEGTIRVTFAAVRAPLTHMLHRNDGGEWYIRVG